MGTLFDSLARCLPIRRNQPAADAEVSPQQGSTSSRAAGAHLGTRSVGSSPPPTARRLPPTWGLAARSLFGRAFARVASCFGRCVGRGDDFGEIVGVPKAEWEHLQTRIVIELPQVGRVRAMMGHVAARLAGTESAWWTQADYGIAESCRAAAAHGGLPGREPPAVGPEERLRPSSRSSTWRWRVPMFCVERPTDRAVTPCRNQICTSMPLSWKLTPWRFAMPMSRRWGQATDSHQRTLSRRRTSRRWYDDRISCSVSPVFQYSPPTAGRRCCSRAIT